MHEIYCSIVAHRETNEDYYAIKLTQTFTLAQLRANLDREPGCWVRMHSNYGTLHVPIFDFDDKVDVWDIVEREGLSGHVYKTLHGYHFFADGLMRMNDIYYHGINMGVCQQFLDISRKRGFFAIRCGRKIHREWDDIQYIGHTSGSIVEKSRWLKTHDSLCRIMTQLYEPAYKKLPFSFTAAYKKYRAIRKEDRDQAPF